MARTTIAEAERALQVALAGDVCAVDDGWVCPAARARRQSDGRWPRGTGAEPRPRVVRPPEPLVEKAKCLFAEHVNGHLDMRAVSADLHVGYSAFTRVFKRSTGVSPYHYFLSMKVEKAKALLADAHLPVKEVARRLSFENQGYFSRLFKRMTGVAPRWHEGDGAGNTS